MAKSPIATSSSQKRPDTEPWPKPMRKAFLEGLYVLDAEGSKLAPPVERAACKRGTQTLE